MMDYVFVLILSFVNNVLLAFYIKYVSEDSMFRGAVFGESIMVCGAFLTINYVKDNYLLIPLIIGGFLGTYYSRRIKNFIDKNR